MSHGIFGLNQYTSEDSKLILLPIPWEVTTSYGSGTSLGPQAILTASPQLDLYDYYFGEIHEQGIYMLPICEKTQKENHHHKQLAQWVIDNPSHPDSLNKIDQVNQACDKLENSIYETCTERLRKGQIVGLIGGDHSTPQGLIKALSEHYSGDFGILHIDAHADLRKAYQGFSHSHASIMHNVMSGNFSPQSLVQVGIRDFCEEEFQFISSHKDIHTFFDPEVKSRLLSGDNWKTICQEVLAKLPERVYISFDIDGLSPNLCPNTGTPVPGGLSFEQASFLISQLKKSGKTIVGFDLVEVAPSKDETDEWDGNVGARILYQLCGYTLQC